MYIHVGSLLQQNDSDKHLKEEDYFRQPWTHNYYDNISGRSPMV